MFRGVQFGMDDALKLKNLVFHFEMFALPGPGSTSV